MTLRRFLDQLQGVRREGNGWKALCPAHRDKNPSLSIHKTDGRILIHCFAGCTVEAICGAVGIGIHDLGLSSASSRRISAIYNHTDEEGKLLYQVLRLEPKAFRQRRPNGCNGWIWNLNSTRRVLYGLPEVLKAKTVLIVEGEQDADAGRSLGFEATCNSGGAGRWKPEYSDFLHGKNVAIIADADVPGRRHAQEVAKSLAQIVLSLKVLELPGAKDLSEWVQTGGTQEALHDLVRTAPDWRQKPLRVQKNSPVICPFSNITPRSLKWLWRGRIPLGKLTLLIGDPGLGKSLVTVDIASRVSRGVNFPDGAVCEAGSVILLSAEDDPGDTIRPRLDAAGADVTRVHMLESVRTLLGDGSPADRSFDLKRDLPTLENALSVIVPAVRLVVFDPLSAFLGGANAHVNSEVRALLSPLVALAARRGIAVLGVTHLRKSAGPAIHRAIESIAFAAASRAALAVARDPGEVERRLFLPVKQNLSAESAGLAFRIVEVSQGTAGLAWEPGAVNLDVDYILSGFEYGEDRSACREAEIWLKERLRGGAVLVEQIRTDAEASGLAWSTMRRAKQTMGVLARKTGYHGGWTWQLPNTGN
jgi:putative DNA primase/helicase